MANSTSKAPRKGRKPRANVLNMPASTANEEAENPITEPPAAEEASPSGAEGYSASRKAFPPAPKGSGKGGYCKDAEGMTYWRSLPREFQNRTNIYVNREWPILDRLQELDAEQRALVASRKRREPFKYIDKPAEPFGEDWRMEFLQRYGSGTYKIYVNDAGVRGARDAPELQPHTLCKFLVSVNDSDFPPVLDPGRPDKGLGILDRKHPQNQSYIADLRARGVLPLEEGETMQGNNSQVVKDLADKVGDLAGQVAGGKQEALLREIKDAVAPKANNGDALSVKMLELVIALTSKPAAAPVDTSTPLVSLFQSQILALQQELREERIERRKYEDSIRERANQPAPDPFSFFERMVSTLQKGKEIFGTGAAAAADGRPASKMSGTLEFFNEFIPKILEAPILNAVAQRLTATLPGVTNPAQRVPGQQQPSSEKELLAFVQNITPAMLSYLESDSTGANFAEWVHCGFPDRLSELQQQSPSVVIATYQESPLWPRLAPREMQFRKFVADFCAWRPSELDDAPAPASPQQQTNGAHVPTVIDFDADLAGPPIEGDEL